MFHMAAEEDAHDCLKLLVYNYSVDPDAPDWVCFS